MYIKMLTNLSVQRSGGDSSPGEWLRDGVREGLREGVREGLREGVREGLREGVRDADLNRVILRTHVN